jgi:hypothetical protein
VPVYRQRTTVADEFLLGTLFPWLVGTGATPLLRLARIWSQPVVPRGRAVGRSAAKPRSADQFEAADPVLATR